MHCKIISQSIFAADSQYFPTLKTPMFLSLSRIDKKNGKKNKGKKMDLEKFSLVYIFEVGEGGSVTPNRLFYPLKLYIGDK